MGTTESPAIVAASAARSDARPPAAQGISVGRWFSPAQPPQEARIRLLLMPHAGSGAAAYRGWNRLLPAEFGALFKDLGAFPEELWTDPDMLDLVLPPVIADFRIAVQYEDDEAIVDCPLVTYAGGSDPLLVEPDAMMVWTERSRRYLGHQVY